ncbi:MAG: hypothetical protein NTY35_16305 [Planctomycetota bacterium]|nr:hypothetical protein [Planctomycetota bacterium]
MRILVRVAIGLGLLVVLALGLVWIFQGSVVKAAIQGGGTWATGVETRVEDVSAGLLGGKLELRGLTLANPPGFSAEPFFGLRAAKADWDTASLLSQKIHVRELELDGLALRIERNSSGTNYGRILEHASRGGAAPAPTPEAQPGAQRALVVDRIVLRDVSAELYLADLPLANGPLRVTVPRVEITDFHSDGPTHEIVGQLLSAVVKAALEASLDAGRGTFPDDLKRDLKAQLQSAKSALEGALQGDVKGSLEGLKDVFGDKKK